MDRAVEVVTGIARQVFAREELPPASPEPVVSRRSERPGLLRTLLASEPLPSDLPPRAAPTTDRRSVLGRLLGPDPLPLDPPLPRRSSGRWLAWLFAPERLEP